MRSDGFDTGKEQISPKPAASLNPHGTPRWVETCPTIHTKIYALDSHCSFGVCLGHELLSRVKVTERSKPFNDCRYTKLVKLGTKNQI